MKQSELRGRGIRFFLMVVLLFFWASCMIKPLPNFLVKRPPSSKKKAPFPVFDLPAPQNVVDAHYLGVSGAGTFKVNKIKCSVLIMEIFSKNCVHCQNTTSVVHQLYRVIQARWDLKERIKIIGIGANNSRKKVEFFRTKYHVPFPLFPDKYGAISKKFDIMVLPAFVVVKINGDETMEEIYFDCDGFFDANNFLAEIIKQANLAPGEAQG